MLNRKSLEAAVLGLQIPGIDWIGFCLGFVMIICSLTVLGPLKGMFFCSFFVWASVFANPRLAWFCLGFIGSFGHHTNTGLSLQSHSSLGCLNRLSKWKTSSGHVKLIHPFTTKRD